MTLYYLFARVTGVLLLGKLEMIVQRTHIDSEVLLSESGSMIHRNHPNKENIWIKKMKVYYTNA